MKIYSGFWPEEIDWDRHRGNSDGSRRNGDRNWRYKGRNGRNGDRNWRNGEGNKGNTERWGGNGGDARQERDARGSEVMEPGTRAEARAEERRVLDRWDPSGVEDR